MTANSNRTFEIAGPQRKGGTTPELLEFRAAKLWKTQAWHCNKFTPVLRGILCRAAGPAEGILDLKKAVQNERQWVISELRRWFNQAYAPEKYAMLQDRLRERCGSRIEFRISETPIFLPAPLLEEMADQGAALLHSLIADGAYLEQARQAIPQGYRVANETPHPHFLTADFALVHDTDGRLAPRLVEIQAFPSVFGYQAVLCSGYREVFELPDTLRTFLGGLSEAGYWALLARTILGGHDRENVVLTEIDPMHQKTLSDFTVTARRLGISVVDIAGLHPIKNKLHYRNAAGRLVPIHRIYNRAIADELIARGIELPFDLSRPWDVEWAGHPNWYFLISKFSIPWLSRRPVGRTVVPPAVFLSDFLEGHGRQDLLSAGVTLPGELREDAVYSELLLKPLFSFAGKGIHFEPTHAQLEAIPQDRRGDFLLQQRMRFVPTIDTPHGLTQAEIRILYMWPDGGSLTPTLSLVRLGRGKMMGVDHNRNQSWVGGSAAFFPDQR